MIDCSHLWLADFDGGIFATLLPHFFVLLDRPQVLLVEADASELSGHHGDFCQSDSVDGLDRFRCLDSLDEGVAILWIETRNFGVSGTGFSRVEVIVRVFYNFGLIVVCFAVESLAMIGPLHIAGLFDEYAIACQSMEQIHG